MTMDLLWTDQCFLTVLLLGLCAIVNGLRKEPIRESFSRIFQRPIAVSAFVILMFFLSIAVLDSIHYHTTAAQSPSIIDRVLAPLGDVYEKTYSAPLAETLYATEMVIVKGGEVQQIYPRLSYVPKRIKTNEDKWRFVTHALYKAVGTALLVVLGVWCLSLLVTYFLTIRRGIPTHFKALPSRAGISALITIFVCVVFLMASYWISRELHLFGTGKIGQDIFYYAIKSIRTGLVIGILTTLFMMPLALLLGISAGYFGGVIDDMIQYLYTTLSSIPGVLLITASVLSMQTYIANHPAQFTNLAQNAE